MALLRSVLRQLFERFAHFLRRRETPLRAQECAAKERGALEKLPEASVMKAGENEPFDFTAKNKKRRKRRRQYGEKKKERKVKKREMNEGGSHKDKAEKEKETLSLEEIKDREHVPQKERESAAEPTPLLVEVKPLRALVSPPERSSFLKPLEGDLPLLPCVSEDLPPPAARFRPLPPVTKPPMCPQTPDPAPEEVSLPCSAPQVSPPKPLAVPPRPTPASDELFSFRLSLPKQLVVASSPTPASDEVVDLRCSSTEVCPPSPVESLMLIDIEDEETEYVEYTGKTYQARDLPKTKRMIAWLESDSEEEVWTSEVLEEVWTSEVLEEVWTSEVLEVHGFEEEEDNPGEMGDSKAVEGHLEDASQEKEVSDGNMKELFCVGSPEGPENETQHNVVVQKEPKSKRKVAFFLFAWAEWKAKKKEEKKMRKEKERKDKELLLERYRNDPKLKHLLINKHNRHNCSSE